MKIKNLVAASLLCTSMYASASGIYVVEQNQKSTLSTFYNIGHKLLSYGAAACMLYVMEKQAEQGAFGKVVQGHAENARAALEGVGQKAAKSVVNGLDRANNKLNSLSSIVGSDYGLEDDNKVRGGQVN